MAKIWQPGQKKETPEEKAIRMQHNAQMLALPYEAKVALAESRVIDWRTVCTEYGKRYAVSVGGLDSITLLAFVREVLHEDVDGISISSLEDKSIQAVHAEMHVKTIKPLKSKT